MPDDRCDLLCLDLPRAGTIRSSRGDGCRPPIDHHKVSLLRLGLLRRMSAGGRELPMAPGGCTLDESSLIEQLDRYRRLGSTAVHVEDRELGLVISFGADLDLDVLRETIATERGCCSFFELDYNGSERRLSIVIDEPARADALRALRSALGDSSPPPAAAGRSR